MSSEADTIDNKAGQTEAVLTHAVVINVKTQILINATHFFHCGKRRGSLTSLLG